MFCGVKEEVSLIFLVVVSMRTVPFAREFKCFLVIIVGVKFGVKAAEMIISLFDNIEFKGIDSEYGINFASTDFMSPSFLGSLSRINVSAPFSFKILEASKPVILAPMISAFICFMDAAGVKSVGAIEGQFESA